MLASNPVPHHFDLLDVREGRADRSDEGLGSRLAQCASSMTVLLWQYRDKVAEYLPDDLNCGRRIVRESRGARHLIGFLGTTLESNCSGDKEYQVR